MVLGLFRKGLRKAGDKLEKPSMGWGRKSSVNTTSAYSNIGNIGDGTQNSITSIPKTVVLAELVKILANPSQLLELVRRSPILHIGYVQDDDELKNIVKEYGGTPLLLSIKSSSSSVHVIYLDGKFYTLTDGGVKVVDRLVHGSNGVRVVIYKLE